MLLSSTLYICALCSVRYVIWIVPQRFCQLAFPSTSDTYAIRVSSLSYSSALPSAMSPEDQNKRVQIALQSVAQRARDSDLASNVNREIQSSLAFRYNGQELFSAVPSALTCIGAAYVVMNSDAAQKISLDPGKEQFRYIR